MGNAVDEPEQVRARRHLPVHQCRSTGSRESMMGEEVFLLEGI